MENGLNRHPAKPFANSSPLLQLPEAVATTTGIVGDDLSRMHDIDEDIDAVISINARRYGKGLMTRRFEKMSRMAFSEGKSLILMNQVGGSGDIVYDGTSGVLNSEGRLVLLLDSFKEDMRIFDTEAENRAFDVPMTTYNDPLA